jgi:hypothetical protein
MVDNPTRALLRYIGTPLLPGRVFDTPVEDERLFNIAFRNNVEMLYFSALERAGKLDTLTAKRDETKARQLETVKTIVRLSSTLTAGGIAHAVTKTLRPYPGTPNDIDCLYLGDLKDYEAAGDYMLGQHYRLTGPKDMQYEFFDELQGGDFYKDKTGGRFYIDFYRELAADHMPYMDSALLRHYVVDTVVEGHDAPVKVFLPEAEMVVLSLHSVLMHRIVPLEVFYTYSYLIQSMDHAGLDKVVAVSLASHAGPAMRTVLSLMEGLYTECFGEVPAKLGYLLQHIGRRPSEGRQLLTTDMKMPHVVNLSTFVISVFSKTRGARARRGFFKELAHMLNPVFAVEVLYHMLSKKYIDKHSDHV